MKKFFKLSTPYKFEWNDLRCLFTIINVILIIIYKLSISWIGLLISIFGIIKDLTADHRLNGLIMHTFTTILSIYFILEKF